MFDKEIEKTIREFFDDNYEIMQLEGGHSITSYTKEEALNQILFYYHRNKDLINKITDAEVKLTLPEQKTPKQKIKYTIEGIVDILREGDETWMYDIKTHDLDYIKNNKEIYSNQLNIYAYIWKTLRSKDLDNTAVLSTSLPDDLKNSIKTKDDIKIEEAVKRWDPIIPLGFSEENIDEMIAEFGYAVENIENKRFSPPSVERLNKKDEGERNIFAVKTCRNCDARFSCESFREYVRTTGKGGHALKKYLEDYGTDIDPDEFIDANLDEEQLNSVIESIENE
jgi:hypothetical protein